MPLPDSMIRLEASLSFFATDGAKVQTPTELFEVLDRVALENPQQKKIVLDNQKAIDAALLALSQQTGRWKKLAESGGVPSYFQKFAQLKIAELERVQNQFEVLRNLNAHYSSFFEKKSSKDEKKYLLKEKAKTSGSLNSEVKGPQELLAERSLTAEKAVVPSDKKLFEVVCASTREYDYHASERRIEEECAYDLMKKAGVFNPGLGRTEECTRLSGPFTEDQESGLRALLETCLGVLTDPNKNEDQQRVALGELLNAVLRPVSVKPTVSRKISLDQVRAFLTQKVPVDDATKNLESYLFQANECRRLAESYASLNPIFSSYLFGIERNMHKDIENIYLKFSQEFPKQKLYQDQLRRAKERASIAYENMKAVYPYPGHSPAVFVLKTATEDYEVAPGSKEPDREKFLKVTFLSKFASKILPQIISVEGQDLSRFDEPGTPTRAVKNLGNLYRGIADFVESQTENKNVFSDADRAAYFTRFGEWSPFYLQMLDGASRHDFCVKDPLGPYLSIEERDDWLRKCVGASPDLSDDPTFKLRQEEVTLLRKKEQEVPPDLTGIADLRSTQRQKNQFRSYAYWRHLSHSVVRGGEIYERLSAVREKVEKLNQSPSKVRQQSFIEDSYQLLSEIEGASSQLIKHCRSLTESIDQASELSQSKIPVGSHETYAEALLEYSAIVESMNKIKSILDPYKKNADGKRLSASLTAVQIDDLKKWFKTTLANFRPLNAKLSKSIEILERLSNPKERV